MQSRHLFFTAIFACLIFCSCSSTTNPPSPATYHIIPRSEALPYGQTWEAWSSAWWRWAVQMPPNHHPSFGNGPLDTLQSGNVWFIGGIAGLDTSLHRNSATASGTIPYGTALLFMVAGVELDTANGVYPYPGTTLTYDCRAGWSYIKLISGLLTVDGNDVPNVLNYFVDTSMCSLYLPDSSLSSDVRFRGGPPSHKCTSPAATCGVYFFIDSLSRGDHVIHAQGESSFGNGSITYKITVH